MIYVSIFIVYSSSMPIFLNTSCLFYYFQYFLVSCLLDSLSFWYKQEIIADPAIESPDLAIAKQMMRLHVHSLLKILKAKEKAIIQLQFGIHCDEPKSLSQIGAMYGLSKERIRQIGNQALKKLKKCLLAQGLEAYLELLTWLFYRFIFSS